jgi:FtsP/CotA-like multicopper oxidase with cupredoxin domain
LKKSIFSSEPIKRVFIVGLSVGLVIGIITSNFLFPPTHTSFYYFSKDAKAISSVSGVPAGIHQAPNKKYKDEVTLVAERASVMLKDRDNASMWTFNGTVPGPTLRFKEGDKVTIHLINNDQKQNYHTIHLHVDHAAMFDGVYLPSIAYQTKVGKNSTTYTFIAEPAGAFPYHCHAMNGGGNSQHMRMGMYGLMIIDPKVPLEPAREYGIVMGEYSNLANYSTSVDPALPTNASDAIPKISSNFRALMTILPKYFLNNGYSDQYLLHPLPAWQNETVRLYVVNDGVGLVYPFHIHAQIFKAYPSGLISGDGWSNKPEYRQTVLIGPGDAAIIEIKWSQPGSYLFHAHGIEEENGGMGCFYVFNSTVETGAAACGMPPTHRDGGTTNITEIKKAYDPYIETPVTNKTGSISMIKSQYMQQIALQHPTCTEPMKYRSLCAVIPSSSYLKYMN